MTMRVISSCWGMEAGCQRPISDSTSRGRVAAAMAKTRCMNCGGWRRKIGGHQEKDVPIPTFLENANGQSVYNRRAGNRVIQISAAEAAIDFPGLLDHVRVGDEVVIEHDACPATVVRPAATAPSLDKASAAVAREAPDEGWRRVPSDLARNLDTYFYICKAR